MNAIGLRQALRWLVRMVVLIIFAVAGVLLLAPLVDAAPKATSSMECGIAADMAVVARALAEERIERQRADSVMHRIYELDESERGEKLMRAIMATAYGLRDTSPQDFAEELYRHCMRGGGDMDGVLGVEG